MNKAKLAIIIGSVAALLTTAAVAFAQTNTNNNVAERPSIMQDAIDKGIINQEQANNLKNYAKEQRQQKMQNRLDQAVKDSTITQDEANQIKSWCDSRPAALEKLGKGFGRGGIRRNFGM